jgi:hypothetical protein
MKKAKGSRHNQRLLTINFLKAEKADGTRQPFNAHNFT